MLTFWKGKYVRLKKLIVVVSFWQREKLKRKKSRTKFAGKKEKKAGIFYSHDYHSSSVPLYSPAPPYHRIERVPLNFKEFTQIPSGKARKDVYSQSYRPMRKYRSSMPHQASILSIPLTYGKPM
jgi:hypothetical protein